MPLIGPCVAVTLMLRSFTFSLKPPGSAMVRRMAVRRVVVRLLVVTRLRTVAVRFRFAAGRAGLRRLFVAGLFFVVLRAAIS